MIVLSLFDGISCGRLALEQLGIQVDAYYASEIEKASINISKKNFPEIIQIGDVTKFKLCVENGKKFIKSENGVIIKNVDLLIAGSPCQGFSAAGKGMNFDDPRSRLFFEFVKIKDFIKPKNFLLENVKMKKEWQDVISSFVGFEPVEINSSILTAQNRKRLYWTNLKIEELPKKEESPFLYQILENDVDEKYFLKDEVVEKSFKNTKNKDFIDFLTSQRIGTIGNGGQGERVYSINAKSVTLSALGGGRGAKTGLYAFAVAKRGRYAEGGGTEQHLEVNFDEKSNCITSVQKDSMVGILSEKIRVRRLTPLECERLQGVRDGYTAGVSDSARYKALGNGWTVPVIAHVLKGIL